MKLWEVIKELTEDTTKKFVLNDGDRIYTLSAERGGVSNFFMLSAINEEGVNISHLDSGQFDGNFATDEDDWQPVRQPVTWQEAIQAWADGKTIKCEHGQITFVYNPDDEFFGNHSGVHKRLFTNGSWYVDD